MILVIDNYDSFTYNLVQYLGELGAEVIVRRNDEIPAAEVGALGPAAIVLSPGPRTPAEAGITLDVIRTYGSSIPILGVCLGQQAIGAAYGGRVVRANRLMHGKTSEVRHNGSGLFAGLPDPLRVMRYHSLTVDRDSLPSDLEITAWSDDDSTEVHAMQHRTHPVYGVQFHPESVLTEGGKQLLRNFLDVAR
ncbi:MAG TPA: aminodeoxychorismate/anthranilate synthase component II [Gemmatimonadaceae bacterium]|jgi:anthranilate synthase/aminodeoxychorismate synthase-like glutamine amidotransferase|nr:aminodeoxychorismate/anthranilate synthase component II [Gemmatimonadaceae bacterium]